MTGDLWRLDATELARLIRLGRASSCEATQSCLARLHAVNPAINAVVRILEEEALAAAAAADAVQARGDALGPLHGVPVTTKVNTDQAGCPTDNGVVALAAIWPPPAMQSRRSTPPTSTRLSTPGTISVRPMCWRCSHRRWRSTATRMRKPRCGSGASWHRRPMWRGCSARWRGATFFYGVG